ncbi:hypothetical protein [Pseudomonas sp. NFX15]|uniref:hypothetical protein n=1 Tax=Pseudomonas sp. NFX15 TaxID=2816958 RepID=UPI003BA180A2
MLDLAKNAILDSGDFLSLEQAAQRLGLPPVNLDDWETEGKIFSIQHCGCSRFPMYAFLAGESHGPVPGLKMILGCFENEKRRMGNRILVCFSQQLPRRQSTPKCDFSRCR